MSQKHFNLLNSFQFFLIILIIGVLLRVWGLDFGLPYSLHQDEPIIINHAIAYGSGDLNPHFFIIPPLCSYLLFACYVIYFAAGTLLGIFSGTDSFALSFFIDPSYFYLIARVLLGLIPGIVAVFLTYVLHKKLFSVKGAWYASLIMAIAFLPVVNSHYAYVDNMMAMAILLVYVSMANMMKNPSRRNYLISGALLGAAVGIKYNAGLLVFSFLAAHMVVFYRKGRDMKKSFFSGDLLLAALTAFLVFSVSILFNWPSLVEGLQKIRKMDFHGLGMSFGEWALHHIRFSLTEGMGVYLLVAGVLGFLAILWKEKLSVKIFFLIFPLTYCGHLVFASQRFSRYGLSLVPFLAVGAAFFIFNVLMPLSNKRLWKGGIVVLAIALLIPTGIKSIKADALFASGDTRAISAQWVEENLPEGSKIAADHTAFRPQLSQTTQQLREKYKVSGVQEGLKGAKEKKLGYMMRAAEDKKTYNVFFLVPSGKKKLMFLSQVPTAEYDVEVLQDKGIEYVSVNYYTSHSRDVSDFLEELREKGDIVASFSPYEDGNVRSPKGSDTGRDDYTFMNIGSEELFSRRNTGPAIEIYSIKRSR